MRKIVALAAILLSTSVLAEDRVTVSNVQVGTAPEGYQAVLGLAHNNTNSTLANVFVKFKLYDASGSIVGNTIAHGQDIGPGENWKFSAPTSQPFSRAVLSSITAQ